jgi:hypothetical protein
LWPDPRAECIYFGEHGFVGRHYGYGSPVVLHVALMPSSIRIAARSEDGKFRPELPQLDRSGRWRPAAGFSPGYGVLLRRCLGDEN